MKLITIPEGAKLLRIGKKRVYVLINRKDFFSPGVVIRLGRQIRFNKDALVLWMEKVAVTGQPEELICKAAPSGP
jgi:excisionase family DNA binding protein